MGWSSRQVQQNCFFFGRNKQVDKFLQKMQCKLLSCWNPRWWQLKYFWIFCPEMLGKWSISTNIFQMGWKPPTRICFGNLTKSPNRLWTYGYPQWDNLRQNHVIPVLISDASIAGSTEQAAAGGGGRRHSSCGSRSRQRTGQCRPGNQLGGRTGIYYLEDHPS